MKNKNISVGKMRVMITLQLRQTAQDGAGGNLEVWSDHLDIKAAMDDAATSRQFKNGAMSAAETRMFTIRYLPAITDSMRIKFGDDYYNISGIANVGNSNMFLELTGEKI
jgi:SPP1 family predicted phage head-tail adaptor